MLKIGDLLILEPMDSGKKESYKCKVVEKVGDKVYIDYPIHTETKRTVFLLDGTQLKASFVTNDGVVFLFECEVLDRVRKNIPMIVLNYPGDDRLVKIQRRQFVRVETATDVAVHSPKMEFSPFVAVTADISAGGAAIISDQYKVLKPDMVIHSWYVLPMQSGEINYVQLKSKIVRIVDGGVDTKKIISTQFIDTNPTERQLLLRFCFDQQLAHRKKGL